MEVQELLTIEELAAKLKVCTRTVRRLTDDQKIAATKIGGQWRFTPDAVNAYIKSRTMKIKNQPA